MFGTTTHLDTNRALQVEPETDTEYGVKDPVDPRTGGRRPAPKP